MLKAGVFMAPGAPFTSEAAPSIDELTARLISLSATAPAPETPRPVESPPETATAAAAGRALIDCVDFAGRDVRSCDVGVHRSVTEIRAVADAVMRQRCADGDARSRSAAAEGDRG